MIAPHRARSWCLLAGLTLAALPVPACMTSHCRKVVAVAPLERWALHDGRRVHFLDSGAHGGAQHVGARDGGQRGGRHDEALVLIHGWAGSVAAWPTQLADLSGRARVLAVDLTGHGGSELPARPLDLATMADSVIAAMDEAGVRRAVLVGHSNGVPVAQLVLARHPGRVLGLVGVDGTLHQLFTAEQLQPLLARLAGPEWRAVVRNMVASMPAPDLADEQRAAIAAMALATPHRTVVEAAQATLVPEAWPAGPITVPLLLLLAEQPTWDAAFEAAIRARAPQVDYVVWSGVGHYLHVERPEAFRDVLVGWLDRHELLVGGAR